MPSMQRATAIAAAAVLAACAAPPTTAPADVGELRAGSGYLKGYLDRKALPDSLALLPPPPGPGSAQAAADLDAYRTTRALRGSPRWTLAAQDAVLRFPAAGGAMQCALGVPVSADATPHLTMLLRRTLADGGLATYAAKDHYKRTRPFAELKEGTCAPGDEAALAKDGSYPSGHAALGWTWALVLAQVAPERTDALLARGHAFGQSRVICGVHWQSDVDAGRVMGAAAFARLQSDPTFLAQLEAARKEVAAARAKGLAPQADCAAEAAALKR
jgi:acid phosphatase (class A)